MDATRFDRLARSLTAARSRRGAAGTLLGGALGLLGLADTAARKGRKKKGKQNTVSCSPAGANELCCSGVCGAGAAGCIGRNAGTACDFSAQCATGFCSPSGFCRFAAP